MSDFCGLCGLTIPDREVIAHLEAQLAIEKENSASAWKTTNICEKDRQLWENRYRKLKGMCWAEIRVVQDRAHKGEDFDKLVDEYQGETK